MAWENRDYYRGSSGGSDFFGNPASILSIALPFGTWFGARVRLHFWLLLSFLFITIGLIRYPVVLVLTLALYLLALMLHEYAHRFMARRFGTDHNEFVLWPGGGMVSPATPPQALPMFLVHSAGIGANVLLAAGCAVAIHFMEPQLVERFLRSLLNPLAIFAGFGLGIPAGSLLLASLWIFMTLNVGVAFLAILPYYIFDGAHMLQAILWPWAGLYRAINITCIVGMVLAVPMFFIALTRTDFFGMIFWVLLFSSSYVRRQQLKAEGTHELEDAIAYSATASVQHSPARRSRWARWNRGAAAAKRAARDRKDQQRIDEILGKVHASGMQSLTWWEKRALRKATERQRRAQD